MKKVWMTDSNEPFAKSKDVPETFEEFVRLCKDLKNDKVELSLGQSIILKIEKNKNFRFSKAGVVWFEYADVDKIDHPFMIADYITPEQMWDMINCLLETKTNKIKKLKQHQKDIFDCAIRQWQFGSKENAKSLFVEACDLEKRIKSLEEK